MKKINTEVETIVVKKVAYEAVDGTVFATEDECVQYESRVMKPLDDYLKEFGFADDKRYTVTRTDKCVDVEYGIDTVHMVKFGYNDDRTLVYPWIVCEYICLHPKVDREESWPTGGMYNHCFYWPTATISTDCQNLWADSNKLDVVSDAISKWKENTLPQLKTMVDLIDRYRTERNKLGEEYAKKVADLFFGMSQFAETVTAYMDNKGAYRDREAWDEHVQSYI